MKTTAAVGGFEIEELELFQSQAVETGYACPFIDCKRHFKKSCDLRVHFLVEVTTCEDRRESSPSSAKYVGESSDGISTSDLISPKCTEQSAATHKEDT